MAKTVYVIDDDTGLRTAYAAALHKLGYEVETAADGLEAKELVSKGTPDLILLDMLMPNLDGISFLKEYRETEGHENVKVVIVSNMDVQPEAELNVTKHMSKLQFAPDAVAAKVDEILKEQSPSAG